MHIFSYILVNIHIYTCESCMSPIHPAFFQLSPHHPHLPTSSDSQCRPRLLLAYKADPILRNRQGLLPSDLVVCHDIPCADGCEAPNCWWWWWLSTISSHYERYEPLWTMNFHYKFTILISHDEPCCCPLVSTFLVAPQHRSAQPADRTAPGGRAPCDGQGLLPEARAAALPRCHRIRGSVLQICGGAGGLCGCEKWRINRYSNWFLGLKGD